MAKKKSRQHHLASLFDPQGGNLGAYVRLFLAKVESDKVFSSILHEMWPPLLNKARNDRKFHASRRDFDATKLRFMFAHKGEMDITSAGNPASAPDIFYLIQLTQNCLQYILEETIPYQERNLKSLGKEKTKEQRELAEEIYNNSSNNFISSPFIILRENLETLKAVIHWLSMHCSTMEDLMSQIDYMLLETIDDKKMKRKISPLEMMGRANNGLIANFIEKRFPTHLDDRPIVRNGTPDNPFIIDPAFTQVYLNQPLKIGGCPALSHRKKVGEIYHGFAKSFLDSLKKVAQYAEENTFESRINLGRHKKGAQRLSAF